MRGIRLILIGMSLLVGPIPLSRAEPDGPPARVLMIHSFGRDFAPFSAVSGRFRQELATRNSRPVEFVEASLQSIQREGAQEKVLVDFLAATFAREAPDLVVPIGAPAAVFYHSHRGDLFPGAPILIVAADRRRLTDMPESEGIAKASLELDLPGLLDDILLIRPRTKRIYYVTGITPLEQFWEKAVLGTWRNLRPDLEFISTSNQSFADVRKTVNRLPADSAVFLGVLDRDVAGIPHEGNNALRSLREVANAPVFGFARDQLGLGIVGGRLVDMEEAGVRAAKAAAEILNGAPSAEVRIEPLVAGNATFDWRELKRWDIHEAALPADSEILFRQPSLWETHRRAVLIAIGVIAVQTLSILLLIAARRRAREAGASLNLAADAANVGIWQVDLEKKAIEATPKWRELFGFSEKGTILLEDVLDRIHPEDRSEIRQAIDEAARQDRSYAVEHRIRHPDGTERWMVSRGRADQFNGNGNHRKTRGVSIDITNRKRSEAQISEQREQMSHLSRVGSLGVISGSLAHELNQPLGTILTNAQAARRMLEKNDPDLEEIREILDDIVGEDRRAGEVIARWRRLLRRGEVNHQAMDLRQCLDEVLRLVRLEITRKEIQVETELPDSLPEVVADPIQLQQVFLNLLLNAADAMSETPRDRRRITVSATEEIDGVQVTVRDRGVGLPPDPESLFEPFFSTKENGLGMGLAICRTFLASCGGRLWAEAEPEGDGACFRLVLSKAETDTASQAPTETAA